MPYAQFAARLQSIDLHYHAGVERPFGVSMVDYVRHAWTTGRRYQGITDHVDLYLNDRPLPGGHRAYEMGLTGIFQLHQEFLNLRGLSPERFPGLRLFFAPEYHTEFFADGRVRFPFEQFPPEIARIADYIICDVGLNAFAHLDLTAQTEAAVRTVREISKLSQRTSLPAYYAHPLRCVIDRTISSYAQPDETVLARIAQAEQVYAAGGALPEAELNTLFQVNLRVLGRAAREFQVPLEVNGMSQDRIRGRHPQLLPAYTQAYTIMAEVGAAFVPGSDQHEIDAYDQIAPRNEPFITLGPAVLDLTFFHALNIDLEDVISS